jgi:integrase
MIRPTPSGKWQARYRDPSGRLRGKTFERKTDAKRFLAAVKTDMSRGAWVDPRRSTAQLEPLAHEWLGNKLHVRPSSFARDEGYLKNHVLPAFGEVPIGRITRVAVQAWVKDLRESRLAPATVRTCYRILRSILEEAVEARLIVESPCRRISLPRIPHREQRYLSAEEVERLARAIDARYRALIYAAVYLGCRWGELVGLKRTNLDLLRARVKIVGALEEVRGERRYVEETKTETSRRMLSVPPFLVEILAEHLRQTSKSEFVFVGREGGVLGRSNFRRRQWKPALEAAGLDPGLRFHDLRHSCAALLIAQGAHPKEIQARLGHASITTTLNTYGHLWPSLGAQLDDRMEQVFHEARANVAREWPEGGSRIVALPGLSAETLT